jgi:hypothetical protein
MNVDETAKWQKEVEDHTALAIRWRRRYNTVNDLAVELLAGLFAPRKICVQAQARLWNAPRSDIKPAIHIKDFGRVAARVDPVGPYVKKGAVSKIILTASGKYVMATSGSPVAPESALVKPGCATAL